MEPTERDQTNPLGYEKIPALLKQFAVPSVIAMLVSSLYNIVDQIFIGNSPAEYLGNGATNVAFPLTTICLAISLLFGVGGAAFFGLSLGRGENRKAARCVSNVLYMSVIFGVIYAVLVEIFLTPLLKAFGATADILPYAVQYASITAIGMPFLIVTNAMSNLVRADGSPRYSMISMVVGAVINTILDPIFIFVFHLDVAGAAIATAISQVISCAVTLAYLPRFHSVALTREDFRPQPAMGARIASLGTSNCLTQLSILLLQIVLNNSLTHYGAMTVYGENIPIAAAGIVMKVNSILVSVFVGLCQGSQPIESFNYGARQYDRVKATYVLAVKCALIVSVAGWLVFQLFPQVVIGIFGSTDDPVYMEFAVRFLRTFLFMTFLNCVQPLSSNLFSAIGQPVKGVLLSLSRQVIILIPLMLILPLFWQMDGLLIAAPIADLSAFLLSIFMVRREFRIMDRMALENR